MKSKLIFVTLLVIILAMGLALVDKGIKIAQLEDYVDELELQVNELQDENTELRYMLQIAGGQLAPADNDGDEYPGYDYPDVFVSPDN